MDIEPAAPRVRRGETLEALGREDLDLYAVEELRERVDGLRAEIARVEAAIGRKTSGRAAAEALFAQGRAAAP